MCVTGGGYRLAVGFKTVVLKTREKNHETNTQSTFYLPKPPVLLAPLVFA
jgi:hypothetical protein